MREGVGRARGGRKSDVSIAAALFAVVSGAVIIVAASRARSAPLCPALPLAAGSTVSGQVLTAAQISDARSVYDAGTALRLPQRAEVIAIATAMQESRLLNLPYGDEDSLGLFQQRPSRGWGTPSEVMDTRYAATAFYSHLAQVPGWQSLPLTVAAQDVQQSRYPDAYAQWEPLATAAVATFSGDGALCSG
jgi:hypothetical protein